MNSPQPEPNGTRQFLLFCLPLLVICFALWGVLGHLVAMPAIGFADYIMVNWMPELVTEFTFDPEGRGALLVSSLGEYNGRMVPVGDEGGNLAFIVNTMGQSYSLPFYTALYFATPREHYAGSYFRGCLFLYVLLTLGLVSVCLKDLMINLGPEFRAQDVAMLPSNSVIAVVYQLNALIIPTLGPAVIWVWQSRDTPVLRGLLPVELNTEET
ncbi:MAG: exosortase H-associated membrane protein [Pseudomonadota bacterium]